MQFIVQWELRIYRYIVGKSASLFDIFLKIFGAHMHCSHHKVVHKISQDSSLYLPICFFVPLAFFQGYFQTLVLNIFRCIVRQLNKQELLLQMHLDLNHNMVLEPDLNMLALTCSVLQCFDLNLTMTFSSSIFNQSIGKKLPWNKERCPLEIATIIVYNLIIELSFSREETFLPTKRK